MTEENVLTDDAIATDFDPKKVPAQILQLTSDIAKTKKRHDDLLSGIIREKTRKLDLESKLNYKTFSGFIDNRPTDFSFDDMADYLDRRLKKNEGIILSHVYYKQIFGYQPNQLYCKMLQNALSQKDIALVPIYKMVEIQGFPTHIAFFIVIHRSQFVALDFCDRLRGIITGKPVSENLANLLVRGSIRVSETLGNYKKISNEVLLEALNELRRDEIYCISMNYFITHYVNPFEFINFIDSHGFHVCRLLNPEENLEETVEEYREYDRLIGVVVSKTGEGIELARNNPEKVMHMCHTAEEGLPKPEQHPLTVEYAQESKDGLSSFQ